jgi:hypothetical protein
MNDDMMDPLVERAAQSMRALPPANPLATMRIMAAVRARRAASPSRMEQLFGWLREPSLSFATAGVLAAAALVVGFVSRGALTTLDQCAAPRGVQPVGYPVDDRRAGVDGLRIGRCRVGVARRRFQ